MYALEDNYYRKDLNNIIYNVGIYTRLSKEDDNNTESESIANQKEYLSRYVIEQSWNLVDIFIDDGYTGTNFDRPDFKRLIKAVESKRINLVIVKDLSRLGRDYIDTGYYIERYFPEKNVRFIALNDGIDTFHNNSNNDMSPFKSVMNDLYSKDISKKVRTSFNVKMRNGDFIGSYAPYGYLKDSNNKNKLITDPKTAWVVKKIFNMFVGGTSLEKISRILNDEAIPSPTVYRKQISKYKGRSGVSELWSAESIRYMLQNPTYTGNIAQNKYKKINYKVDKQVRTPREAWIIVNDTHEPIIDNEIFEHAQQIMNVRNISKKIQPSSPHLLSGLVYCGDCGNRMTPTKTNLGKVYFICSQYKRYRKCSRHSIPEDELESVVINELKKISAYVNNQEQLLEKARKLTTHGNCNSNTEEKRIIENRLLEIKKIIKGLYEDKIKAILTEDDFMDFSRDYNLERERLSFRLIKMDEENEVKKHQEEETGKLIKLVKGITDFTNATKSMLIKLIDRIEIFEKRKITINYKFIKPF
ncbi:recombinase family protein [Pelotomaculum terephthalicicum JT]|uniref:recombinase family protein n=1 Tax=Pelotomaculum terephthalicicum TaxID=206393 RepID=UPI0009CE80F9|nr:recombinase family protein [Pelotomaculum terephthalicicum]MCG9969979.1 recombinase family protein [Pelotomaculum terephthalicicum JT]OPX85202.1 MAG: Recombinase [Pelotomaculum sp. PtaB.Bin104]OPY58024.1 MAG: Recombinase [Pelotomaculum sp. PtaU1.Bin065]